MVKGRQWESGNNGKSDYNSVYVNNRSNFSIRKFP